MNIEPGKLYKTRDGRKARIYATDGWSNHCIHGAVFHPDIWIPFQWASDGHASFLKHQDPFDLVSEWSEPFPEPPPGEEWHNPDGLTAEQVGFSDGWRLLCKSELDGRHTTPEKARPGTTQFWTEHYGWGGRYVRGTHRHKTHRTRTPYAKPAPVVNWELLPKEAAAVARDGSGWAAYAAIPMWTEMEYWGAKGELYWHLYPEHCPKWEGEDKDSLVLRDATK